MTPVSATPRQRGLVLLLLVAILIWCSNLEYRKLVRPDEGRYAEIPREMVATGNWLTPRLNGIKYFEKPPLQYWATAAFYEAFGQHQWTARLWGALTGFAGILLIYLAGLRLFGADAGLYAALVLASSALYTAIGHINTLDMGVTFFMSLSLCGFLLAQRDDASPRENRVWMHVAWAAAALSVLSKGLIGLVLPGAVLVLYSAIQRDFTLWKRLHLGTGLALFFVIAAPWFIAISAASPEFFHFFFIREHFERFLTKVSRRYHPWWYFVPILIAGMAPWLVALFDALPRSWRAEPAKAFQPKRFLLIWAVFIYVFFSMSDSKLPSYILPIFPALALLLGLRFTEMRPRTFIWQVLPIAVLGALGLCYAPQVVRLSSSEVPQTLYAHYVPWLVAAALVVLAGSAWAAYFSYRGKLKPALVAFALTGLVAIQLVVSGHNSLAPANSAYAIAQKIRPYLKPGVPFYSVGMYEQTLDFYIKRTVTLVAFQDEMAFGLKQQPQLWVPDLQAFARDWRSAPYALAVMGPQMYHDLEQTGLPMELVAEDTRRVVVKTPWPDRPADAAGGKRP